MWWMMWGLVLYVICRFTLKIANDGFWSIIIFLNYFEQIFFWIVCVGCSSPVSTGDLEGTYWGRRQKHLIVIKLLFCV